MKNLIPLLRADRMREINECKDKGYIFRNGEDRYNYVRNISISNQNEQEKQNTNEKPNQFSFQVRINQKEPRFYINTPNKLNGQNESCVYLTIYEIYELLLQLSNTQTSVNISNILISERNKTWYIKYTGLEFEFNFFSELDFGGDLIIPESNIEISYENLFILIALIQEKSNYYWSISTEENKEKYSNGILRLLSCLIVTRGNRVLIDRGWKYDAINEKYLLETETINTRKYHLTQKEYENIMGV